MGRAKMGELKRAAQQLGVTSTTLRQQGWRAASPERIKAVGENPPDWLISARECRRAQRAEQQRRRELNRTASRTGQHPGQPGREDQPAAATRRPQAPWRGDLQRARPLRGDHHQGRLATGRVLACGSTVARLGPGSSAAAPAGPERSRLTEVARCLESPGRLLGSSSRRWAEWPGVMAAGITALQRSSGRARNRVVSGRNQICR